MAPLEMMPGRIQRFEVIAELGRGGMGTVYRARDPQLEREVAIKVYEVGIADGAIFVVMEYIAGSDLAQWLDTPRSTADILAAFAQAARGLAAAHAHGIVHRDFKPANVLVGRDGQVRVADFGLSRLWDGATPVLDDGHGTPQFMAPELWRGATATPASDVYALCAALIDALGVDPRTPTATRTQAWDNRKLSPALRKALARGVAEAPEARIQLAELQAMLEPPPARRTRMIAAAALVVVAGGVAAAFSFLPRDSDAEAACRADPALFAGRWDVVQRVRLASTLGNRDPGEVAGLLGVLDARAVRASAVLDRFPSALRARKRGTPLLK